MNAKSEAEHVVAAMRPDVKASMRQALLSTYEAAHTQGMLDAATIAEAHGHADAAELIRRAATA